MLALLPSLSSATNTPVDVIMVHTKEPTIPWFQQETMEMEWTVWVPPQGSKLGAQTSVVPIPWVSHAYIMLVCTCFAISGRPEEVGCPY